MFWDELTEDQKQEEYRMYVNEVTTKHTEDHQMTYAEFCKEWNDCKTLKV